MSITLGLTRQLAWLDLPHGVRLKVRPLDTALYEAARSKARRLVAEVLGEHAEIIAAGGAVEGLPDLADSDAVEGFCQALFVQALARAAIVEWQGVADEAGDPAKLTPETISALMRIPSLAEQFVIAYTAPLAALAAEGKGSRPAQRGTAAAGRATASSAAKGKRRARVG